MRFVKYMFNFQAFREISGKVLSVLLILTIVCIIPAVYALPGRVDIKSIRSFSLCKLLFIVESFQT